MTRFRHISLLASLVLLAVMVVLTQAQDTPIITEDDVAAVAERMYCPICENEPLDDCRAQTCVQWREEIRDQLAAGQSADDIINGFIARYGQKVVGVPQDDFLRSLSFLPIWIGVAVALLAALLTFWRWRRNAQPLTADSSGQAIAGEAQDTYRSQLERDLN